MRLAGFPNPFSDLGCNSDLLLGLIKKYFAKSSDSERKMPDLPEVQCK